MQKRPVDLVVLSDLHLGTYGCHAKELLAYLESIQPGEIILNGDIIDIWQFSKRYWPESHMQVVRKILQFVAQGVPVIYLTGNHDELLRKFANFNLGSFQLRNKLSLQLGAKKAWIFHGDIFDITMHHSKWLAKWGGKGYDLLIVFNRLVNGLLQKMGKPRLSFSQKIKKKVKNAIQFIHDFEQTAADLAIEKGYHWVICGHIHQPEIKTIHNAKGSVLYLNSGDWVESLTSLEFHKGEWTLYKHLEAVHATTSSKLHFSSDESSTLPDWEAVDVRQLLQLLKAE
jgi:UDP-2,3-diacylglucosamine pyrophosphatase LpxH